MNHPNRSTKKIDFKGRDIAENLYSNKSAEKSRKVDIPPKTDLFVLEYSPSQRSFHIETLEDMLTGNIEAFLAGRLTDYVTLAISRDREKINRIVKSLKDKLQ